MCLLRAYERRLLFLILTSRFFQDPINKISEKIVCVLFFYIMELIVGRESGNRRLQVTIDGKTSYFGAPNSVSMGVSRQHCKIEVLENGTMRLSNLNPLNVTYVDNHRAMSVPITEESKIELSDDRYLVDIKSIKQKLIPQFYSIRHLSDIESGYKEATRNLNTKEKRKIAIFGTSGVISSIGITLSLGGFIDQNIRFQITAISVIIAAIGAVVRFLPDKKHLKIEKLQQDYHKQYVCPKCNVFLSMSYDLLKQRGKCPYCGAHFKE